MLKDADSLMFVNQKLSSTGVEANVGGATISTTVGSFQGTNYYSCEQMELDLDSIILYDPDASSEGDQNGFGVECAEGIHFNFIRNWITEN